MRGKLDVRRSRKGQYLGRGEAFVFKILWMYATGFSRRYVENKYRCPGAIAYWSRKVGFKMRSLSEARKISQSLGLQRKAARPPHVTNGYVMIWNPEHARARKNGYVKRAVLVAEKKIGRPLRGGEVVHHDNEIKSDDSPKNLFVMTEAEHKRLHMKRRLEAR